MKPVKAIIGARETVTVSPLATVRETAQLMTACRIGAVAVVDSGRLAGIFTERDIMTRVVAAGIDPSTTAVGELMSTQLIVAEADESYDVCLQRMQQARVRHLVVLAGGQLAGVVSLRDLMGVDLDEKDEAITLLNAYAHHIPAYMQTKL